MRRFDLLPIAVGQSKYLVTDTPPSGASPLPHLNLHLSRNGALDFQCPLSGISYIQFYLFPPFKTPIRNYFRNYGAEIATSDASDTVQ